MATRALDPASPGYRDDGYGWANHQAALIRAGRVREIDWENVAEEIESVGNSERAKAESALSLILQHMLKWDHQPERRGTSWYRTIRVQRTHFRQAIRKNPSLKSVTGEMLADAYEIARDEAAAEMDIEPEALPEACPFTFDDVLEREYRFDRRAN